MAPSIMVRSPALLSVPGVKVEWVVAVFTHGLDATDAWRLHGGSVRPQGVKAEATVGGACVNSA
jgi:hypothetical protein